MIDGGIVSRPASATSSHASTPSRSPSESRLHPIEGGEQRSATDDIVGQRAQPVAKGAVLASSAQVGHGELDEVGGVLVVAARDRVPYGIGEQSVLGEPSAGRGVQLTDPVGMTRSQTGTQCVGEEVVVAIPPALVVERDHEQVLALEGLQHRLTVGTTGQGVAEPAGHLVEHGGVEQERAHLVRLPVQNLLDEVVEDEPMAARERLDEPSDIVGPVGSAGMGAGRQRGQLQPGRPPLGARLESGHECGLQPQPHHLVEEDLGFVGGEPEVRGPHLHELATRPQTRQRERWVGPGRHRQRDLRRQVVEQEGHRLVDGGPVDDVVVVERHHRRTGEDVEIVDQADQDGVGWRGVTGLQQSERIGTSLGLGGLNRRHEVGQKNPDVGVAWVECQPRHSALRVLGRRQPLRQKCGLAEPGRCRDEDQPRPSTSVRAKSVGEAGAPHQPATRRRQVQLGAQYRHSVSVGPLLAMSSRPSQRRTGLKGFDRARLSRLGEVIADAVFRHVDRHQHHVPADVGVTRDDPLFVGPWRCCKSRCRSVRSVDLRRVFC